MGAGISVTVSVFCYHFPLIYPGCVCVASVLTRSSHLSRWPDMQSKDSRARPSVVPLEKMFSTPGERPLRRGAAGREGELSAVRIYEDDL